MLPPKILKEGEHGWEGAFCPFFVCKNTSAEGNMQEASIKHKELQIKALQNFKAIAKHEEICIYAAPEDDPNKSHQSNPSKKGSKHKTQQCKKAWARVGKSKRKDAFLSALFG